MVATDRFAVHSVPGSRVSPRRSSGRLRLHRGFSLVELMVGLVLVAVLMGIGVPMFRSFILEQRLRATSSDLRVALTIARSEAIKRNRGVEVKPQVGGWDKGWTIESPTVGEPNILNNLVRGEMAITTIPADADLQFTPDGRVANTIDFEIDVGPEPGGTVGCLQMQLDGRITSTKGACPNG